MLEEKEAQIRELQQEKPLNSSEFELKVLKEENQNLKQEIENLKSSSENIDAKKLEELQSQNKKLKIQAKYKKDMENKIKDLTYQKEQFQK